MDNTQDSESTESDVKQAIEGMSEKDLIALLRKRYKYMTDADHDNRLEAMQDLRFVNEPGWQWDTNMKLERGQRPCYEFNKLRITCKRIINDIRANRPTGKVRAVEGGDKDNADTIDGLIRNIWAQSNADNAVDYAAEFQVPCGMGAWRVDTEYADDDAFDQDIVISLIENPFCLYADPSCKDPMKRDAEDWILTEKIAHKAYEKRYPKAKRVDFEVIAEFGDDDDWRDEQSVRIAEYWYKVPHKKELWQLQDGTVVDSETDEAKALAQMPGFMEQGIKAKRVVDTNKIMSCIANGEEILEGPTRWAGRKFPFVMVYGEHINIDGSKKWWGIARFAKDAQRAYNFARTSIAETISQAPKAKWWATAEQAEGLETQWAEAHKKNYPFMLYNSDPKSPGPPARMGAADIPQALMAESQIASEEIKEVTGIFDASMGRQGNESSGRAIYARQQQGEIATFNYQDNITNGVLLTYELLIDLIPQIYDATRELRVLGSDGAEKYVKVNQVVMDPQSGQALRVNDLSSGKYDAVVTAGPNFATQRQEAAETYGQLGQQFPQLMEVAGDLIFKSMDLPYAEDIADRLKTLLPPPIQELMNQDKEVPPEVMQMMQQAEQAMQQVQEQGMLVQQAAQELESQKSLNEKQKAEIKTELANVGRARAEFDAHIAQELGKVTKEKVDVITRAAGLKETGAAIKEQTVAQMSKVKDQALEGSEGFMQLQAIDRITARFMQAVDNAMLSMEEKAGYAVRAANRQPVGGGVSRDGGRLTATVQFDDGSEKNVSAVRDQGQLRIVPEDQTPG